MTDKEVKLAIQSAIKDFSKETLTDQAIHLFKILGYNTERQNPFPQKSYNFFKESFLDGDSRFNQEKALVKEWKSVDLLFQLTRDEVSDQKSLFGSGKVKWEGEDKETVIETYLFFAIELIKTDYSRSALAQITREINKIFSMPVMLLFKYGEHLTLSVINRRLHKKDEQKDVLEKVTLIKDISIQSPHRAHIEILFDLSFDQLKRVYKFTNFVELHNAWQRTLDTKELNKRFYRELSNWYFWAINNVSFPNDIDDDKDDTVFNSESIIRLLTRLIFIWFIKEKNLIPDKIFDGKEVSKLIKGFNTKDSTVYYRAILQNLFFATLNQKIEERVFATDGTFEQNKKNYGIKNLYRYSSDFVISKDEVIQLFERVPFLNGGLFDCLDSEDKNGVVMYLDGFSRNPKKQAQVPDELFFSQEKTIDLSTVYDDKRKKNEIVKGLFEIFNHYKFTITENTPIEEEVALDPELLGRVFENLLASYNPETKTTARKQTGSFYTPREIVNYMVDESLKAYLKQKLVTEAGMKPEDAEVWLEFLLGYNEKEHLFDEKQTAVLINAIDNCKILDPACGSGAFPMGILHKLVYILHKLDPYNKLWEERQLEKVDTLIKDAGNINDSAISDKIIEGLEANKKDIEESFAHNELDYGRKLYLIENGIYGVDIQPIATQISKLRFFISLIVDQKADKTKVNFGIRPLPNLETKFVAANTLIGIEKPENGCKWFDNDEVKALEKQVRDIRHQIFSAKTPKAKRELREEDKEIREKMSAILEELMNQEINRFIANRREITEIKYYKEMIQKNGKKPEYLKEIKNREEKLSKLENEFQSQNHKIARQLAAWDPYNQNASSPWFDPEWMFGVKNGFDMVIGNPPYVRADNPAIAEQRIIILKSKQYETLWEKWDLMVPFFERGLKMLEPSGILTFIVSNSITTSKYAEKLQEWIIKDHFVRSIDYFENIEVFEAGVIPVILSLQAQHKEVFTKKIYRTTHFDNAEIIMLDNDTENLKSKVFRKTFSELFNPYIPAEMFRDVCYMSKGMVTNSDEKTAKGEFVKDNLITNTKDEIHCKEYVEGKNIDAYCINKIRYIEYNTTRVPDRLSRPTFRDLYKGDKILRGRVTKGTFDDTGLVCNDSIVVFKRFCDLKNVDERSISVSISKNNFDMQGGKTSAQVKKRRAELEKFSEGYSLKYILAVLNSSYAMAYLNNYRRHRLENYFYPDDFRNYPIPKISQYDQFYFVNIVTVVLFLKKKGKDSSFLESLIDAMVYELYFPDEIKDSDAEVLKYLINLPELKDDWSDEKKLKTIEEVYKELSDPKHPVSIAMEKQKTVPEVRIIEGLPTLSEVERDKPVVAKIL
jgi:adenine-specific DNA-methyltransferase